MIDEPIFWDTLKSRYEALVQQLTASSLEAGVRHKLQKEFSFLSTILEKRDEIRALEQELHELEQQAQDTDDAELKELFDEELEVIRQRVHKAQEVLDELLYPEDELDQRAAFIEIRPGAGGQEASLFVGDLMRMYTNYALKKGWRVVPINLMPTDIGGYKEVILEISGKGAYGSLKHEAGVHRVQRVPATEASGRIHTSTATVAVLPEAQEIEITLDPADVRIDVFRASGAGGQHVNTTDSAVRLTHIPTGIVVSCQDERSQHKNKAKALKILQSRLLAADRERKEMEARKIRKEMVGTGMRAEKVRTYNFPQNRVTDHQVNITLKNLDMVLEGDLDDIIDALLEQERVERRKRPFEFFT